MKKTRLRTERERNHYRYESNLSLRISIVFIIKRLIIIVIFSDKEVCND